MTQSQASWQTRTCSEMLADTLRRKRARHEGPYRHTSATKTSSTQSDTPKCHRRGSRISDGANKYYECARQFSSYGYHSCGLSGTRIGCGVFFFLGTLAKRIPKSLVVGLCSRGVNRYASRQDHCGAKQLLSLCCGGPENRSDCTEAPRQVRIGRAVSKARMAHRRG